MIDGVRAYQVQTDIKENYTNIDGLHFRRDNAGGFTMNGSLHKYHNYGCDNADDFRYSDLSDTLQRLSDELNINPNITQISRVEFGVNIIVPDANDITDSVILFKNDTGKYDNKGRFFDFYDHIIKIYRKTDNVLRVEVRVEKMGYLRKKIWIRTLSDLLNECVLNEFKKILLDVFSDVLMICVPKEKVKSLCDKDKIKYYQYISPQFWNKIRRDKSKNFSREKKKCEQFISCIGGKDLKEKLFNQITEKTDYLLNYPTAKSVKNSTHLDKQINTKVSEIPSLDNSRENLTNGISTTVHCLGCGAIIHNPRKGQMFCSAKVVGYANAHKCRNNASNPKNNTQRSIKKVLSIPLLFDLRETIAPEKRIYL